MYIYINAYIHTYIRTYIHTYTYTDIDIAIHMHTCLYGFGEREKGESGGIWSALVGRIPSRALHPTFLHTCSSMRSAIMKKCWMERHRGDPPHEGAPSNMSS